VADNLSNVGRLDLQQLQERIRSRRGYFAAMPMRIRSSAILPVFLHCDRRFQSFLGSASRTTSAFPYFVKSPKRILEKLAHQPCQPGFGTTYTYCLRKSRLADPCVTETCSSQRRSAGLWHGANLALCAVGIYQGILLSASICFRENPPGRFDLFHENGCRVFLILT